MNLTGLYTACSSWRYKICLLVLFILAVSLLHRSEYVQNIDLDRIEELLVQFHGFPPLFYIILVILVPVLFLPGLPFIVLGGLLYGPIWGLLYAMTGATIGAGVSFLISRYLLGSLISARLSNSRWKKLYQMTGDQGWRIVLFLRLIPLFPYTPLNYALGLTRVRFSHYMIGTALGIFPACSAFIVFSDSLREIMQGEGLVRLLLSFLFLLLILLIPFLARRFHLPGFLMLHPSTDESSRTGSASQ